MLRIPFSSGHGIGWVELKIVLPPKILSTLDYCRLCIDVHHSKALPSNIYVAILNFYSLVFCISLNILSILFSHNSACTGSVVSQNSYAPSLLEDSIILTTSHLEARELVLGVAVATASRMMPAHSDVLW